MIKARGIYINSADTKDERQQEFLIDGELDFSRLSKVQIYCYDEWQASLLRAELEDTKWKNKIKVNRALYVYKNRELSFDITDDTIRISSNYTLPYKLRVSYPNDIPHIVNSYMVSRHKGNDIYLRNSVELKKDLPFKVYFEVDRPIKGSWLIYENK